MSLLRLVLDDVPRPATIFDQNFGLNLMNDDLFSAPLMLRPLHYNRPWRYQTRQQSGTSNLSMDNQGFHVNLDVQQFKPEEISVKNVGNSITVEGKHEERQDDHGFISRHFVRRYVLPEDVEVERVECKLSSDGVLCINAPKKALQNSGSERLIPITQTNRPALKKSESATEPAKTEEEAAKKD